MSSIPTEEKQPKKRGRPKIHDTPEEKPPPKKRGRKPKNHVDQLFSANLENLENVQHTATENLPNAPAKRKKIHDTKTWSVFQQTWETSENAGKEKVIIQLPINADKIAETDPSGQYLIANSQLTPANILPHEFRNIKIQEKPNTPQMQTLEELREFRNAEEKNLFEAQERNFVPIPNAKTELPPEIPIEPPKYNADDIEPNLSDTISEYNLNIVKGFNEEGDPEYFEKGEKIIISSPELSETNSENVSTISDESSLFSLDIKKIKAPGQTIDIFQKKTQIADTDNNFSNEYIPYNSSLLHKGIIHKKIYSVLPDIYIFDENSGTGRKLCTPEKWPKSVDYHCLWCVHTFDGPPVPCPIAYNNSLKTFKVLGCFCSFNCAMAYAAKNNYDQTLVTWFARKWLKKPTYEIKPANDIQMLNIFGGPLSIEEFRRDFTAPSKISIFTEPLIPQIQKIELTNVRPLMGKNVSNMDPDDSRSRREEILKNIPQTQLSRSLPITAPKNTLNYQMQSSTGKISLRH